MLVFHEAGSKRTINTLTNDSFLLHQARTWLWSQVAMMARSVVFKSSCVFPHDDEKISSEVVCQWSG